MCGMRSLKTIEVPETAGVKKNKKMSKNFVCGGLFGGLLNFIR